MVFVGVGARRRRCAHNQGGSALTRWPSDNVVVRATSARRDDTSKAPVEPTLYCNVFVEVSPSNPRSAMRAYSFKRLKDANGNQTCAFLEPGSAFTEVNVVPDFTASAQDFVLLQENPTFCDAIWQA